MDVIRYLQRPSQVRKAIVVLLILTPLALLLGQCTQKSPELKHLENNMLERYPDRFLRAYFSDNGELSLEFELVDENRSTEAMEKEAREYATYGLQQFEKSDEVLMVTVDLQASGTGNVSTAAAGESFTFEAADLLESKN